MNLRPSDPQSDALSRLRHAPKVFYCKELCRILSVLEDVNVRHGSGRRTGGSWIESLILNKFSAWVEALRAPKSSDGTKPFDHACNPLQPTLEGKTTEGSHLKAYFPSTYLKVLVNKSGAHYNAGFYL